MHRIYGQIPDQGQNRDRVARYHGQPSRRRHPTLGTPEIKRITSHAKSIFYAPGGATLTAEICYSPPRICPDERDPNDRNSLHIQEASFSFY